MHLSASGRFQSGFYFYLFYPLEELRTNICNAWLRILMFSKSCHSFQGRKQSNLFGFFHLFVSWNQISTTVFPVRCACRTIPTFHSPLFICYWILTNLNDVWAANTCPKYKSFLFPFFLQCYATCYCLAWIYRQPRETKGSRKTRICVYWR